MSTLRRNPITAGGFTLVTALFVLVVVAALSVYMVNISSVQHTTLVYGVQGARAIQGARSGLEWGIHQAMSSNSCPPATTFNTTGAGHLDNFSITVDCSATDHVESGVTVRVFQITASAESGSFGGNLDYIFRSLQATVSVQPP